MKKIFPLLIFFFLIYQSFATTQFSGGIFSDQTWTKSNSPYLINGNVTIFPNVSLTIESGVEIKFINAISFQVRGNIIFNGAANDSIFISAQNVISYNINSSWVGFRIDCAQGGTVSGKYLKVANANKIFDIFGDRDDLVVHITNSAFVSNNCVLQGIASQAEAQVQFEDCVFKDFGLGIGETDKLKVSNCIFMNGLTAINVHERPENALIEHSEFAGCVKAISAWAIINNCYFHDNEQAIQVFPLGSITNCRIEYNQIGLNISSYPYQITNNNIYNNIICGNGIGIKSNYEYNFQLGPNCWCVEDSELNKSIYDAYDDVTLGIVTALPTQTGCTITPRINPDPVTTTSKKQSKLDINDLIFYPNPIVDNKINFNSDVVDNIYYEVYDQLGKLISYGYILNKNIKLQENLSAGIYMLILKENDDVIYYNKFIK
jgi:hypothetical protein